MSLEKNITDLNTTPVDFELDEAVAAQAQEEEQGEENSLLLSEDYLRHIKPDSRRNERIIAFNLVYAIDRFDYTVDLEDALQSFRDGYDLECAHNEFIVKLVQGVLHERSELDEAIKPFLKNWKLERLGCCTRLILRMALWEMQQPGAVAEVAINEAIELAKLFAEKDAYKFVNGILDEILKHKGAISSTEPGEDA